MDIVSTDVLVLPGASVTLFGFQVANIVAGTPLYVRETNPENPLMLVRVIVVELYEYNPGIERLVGLSEMENVGAIPLLKLAV